MESGYLVKQVSSGLFADLAWLYNEVHEEKADEAQLRHKFATAAFGDEWTGFLAYDSEGKPAAYYGVFPIRLRCNGRTIPGAQSGNTMTHPAHRRKGLFDRLARLTYDDCRNRGIRLVYGIPNPNSYPGFVKLGWKTTGHMEIYTIPLQPSFTTKLFRKITRASFEAGVKRKLGAQTGKQLPASPGIAGGAVCGVVREEAFFRYKTTPGNYFLRLRSGKALVKFSTYGMQLGELFDVSDFADCWDELAALAASLGAYSLSFHVSPDLAASYHIPPAAQKSEGLPIILLDLGSGCSCERFSLTGLDYDTF